MTDAEKQKLIDKLAGGSKNPFGTRYSRDNRKWFVGKIIDSLLSQGVSDASIIEQKTNDIITASGVAVTARLKTGFPSGSLADKWRLYDEMKSRTQIIYGMIAMNPEFLDPANSSYFDFILERRYRAIQRMHFYVNPNNTRNVFAFPEPPEKMKLNKDSIPPIGSGQPAWEGFLGGSLPFILTSSGKSDPVNSDEKLFSKNRGAERNLLACDPVVTILHMDGLRAAKDPDKLLKALAGAGDHYLKIDNPLGHCANSLDGQRLVAVSSAPVNKGEHVDIEVGKTGSILGIIQDKLTDDMLRDDSYILLNRPDLKFMIVLGDVKDTFTIDSVNPVTRMVRTVKLTNSYAVAGAKIYVTERAFQFYSTLPYHFITDTRPDHALFEQLTVKSADLQVGDHIYIINHPLYKIYYPTGAWGGEHSFVTEIGSRDTRDKAFRNTLNVEGHVLDNQTLLSASEEMLLRVNKVLSILQALTRIHLFNLKANGRKSVSFTATTGKFDVSFFTQEEPGPDTNPIDVNVFEYKGTYKYSVMFRGKKLSYQAPGFVIKELASQPDIAFQVFNSDSADSEVDTTHAPHPFLKVEFIGSGAAEQFTVSKWAVTWFNTQTTRLEFLPLFANDNKTPRRLTFDELVIAKPFFVTDEKGDVFVTRPRVDFSSAYQTFLKNNGAI